MEKLLSVRNLSVGFKSKNGLVPAVSGVSFDIAPRETLAIVGESGCGKSVTAMSIIRLLKTPPAVIECDGVFYKDQDLSKISDSEIRKIRGRSISMIFQEPMTSLNPLYRVGDQVAEALQQHYKVEKKAALENAAQLFGLVGIPEPEQRIKAYPHQLSGGMRQRVMIAMAMVCHPDLLIADEPTTALDVTIQAQILRLIQDLQRELDMAMLLITHSMGVVAEVADRVVVMYAGQIVESGTVEQIFSSPRHPYTRGLMGAIPSIDEKKEHLAIIKGSVPSPLFYSKACRFNPRCEYASERCRTVPPELCDDGAGHCVRCHYPRDNAGIYQKDSKGEGKR